MVTELNLVTPEKSMLANPHSCHKGSVDQFNCVMEFIRRHQLLPFDKIVFSAKLIQKNGNSMAY